jgi:hypothetical protein
MIIHASPQNDYERREVHASISDSALATPSRRVLSSPVPGGSLSQVVIKVVREQINIVTITWSTQRMSAEGLSTIREVSRPLAQQVVCHVTGSLRLCLCSLRCKHFDPTVQVRLSNCTSLNTPKF